MLLNLMYRKFLKILIWLRYDGFGHREYGSKTHTCDATERFFTQYTHIYNRFSFFLLRRYNSNNNRNKYGGRYNSHDRNFYGGRYVNVNNYNDGRHHNNNYNMDEYSGRNNNMNFAYGKKIIIGH